MAEIDWPTYNPKEGHIPEMRSVFLDLYRLLAIFLSSKEFSEQHKYDELDVLGDLQEFEWEEATRILISSAIIGRIVDDREDQLLGKAETDVGLLWKDWSRPDDSVVLTLREAFNKIIHADRVRTDLELDEENGLSYFNNVVYFYGTYNGKEWKATLRIVDYASQYYLALRNA